MAEIANSTMFTNGDSSSGTSDLLQRAFQEVVDEEDTENEFVAFLQSDGVESHTIQLTPAQAAALGLSFEVDPVEEASDEVLCQADQNGALTEFQEHLSSDDIVQLQQDQAEDSCSIHDLRDTNLSIDHIGINDDENNSETEDAQQQLEDVATEQNFSIQDNVLTQQVSNNVRSSKIQFSTNLEAGTQCRFIDNQLQNLQFSNIQTSHAQVLKRLPVILPSSQFVLKPAQTVLKPTRNVRILPNTNKVMNSSINAINTVHTINGSSQNSILIPKTKLLNSIPPQMLKATPLTTQLLNSNNIATHLLGATQIVGNSSDISNHILNTSHIGTSVMNTTSVSTQSILNSQICLSSPVLRTTQSSSQRQTAQHFLTPFIKNTTSPIASPVVKSTNILSNGSSKNNIAGQILKPMQIPTQMLRTVTASMIKNSAASTPVLKNTVSNATAFRVGAAVKSAVQDLKSVSSSTASVLRSTQLGSTPISILKPQSKVITTNSSSQNLPHNAHNTTGNSKISLQNSCLQQCVSSNIQKEFNGVKQVQNNTNFIKMRQNLAANIATPTSIKKSKPGVTQKQANSGTEKTDTTKPLGSSENPIQIVQQGHTFHSMQRLTQSQLKQIAHVLQQRSQEAAMPNERIVYRVVFPEELDLRIRNPVNLLRGRGGKRGRPKKSAIRPPVAPTKPTVVPEEEPEEKDERKKVIARTRSGRLSRPPRHMVRDYKHLHHLDFMQPDLDDSDGGYSDYNTNSDKIEDEESPKELLTGLEVPKRKISDHFKCPTCHKIYLGRTRMARHFEMHPDHGSPEQLPPPTPEPELKQATVQDPLKRKGKKRGPWAYVTPEAKSERRQIKLKEAITVCENTEIVNIAAKPVLNALSLYELLILKSENNVRNFLDELKKLMDKIREKAGTMLTVACDDSGPSDDVIDLSEDLLCDSLGLNPGLYRINNSVFEKTPVVTSINTVDTEEPILKRQRVENSEDVKENMDEHMSSGFSENSDLSVSDFLNDRKTDSNINANCPEVLTALTLMPRNPSPVDSAETNKTDNMSKLLISNPEIQNQISDSSGFQKIDINTSKVPGYQKIDTLSQSFQKLGDTLEASNCTQVFAKVEGNFQHKIEHLNQAFVKLEPLDSALGKLDAKMDVSLPKQESCNFSKVKNDFQSLENGSQELTKGFQKLESSCNQKIEITNSITKVVPITSQDMNSMKAHCTVSDNNLVKMLPITAISKITESLPVLHDAVSIISSTCDSNLFGSTENLDMSKIGSYDHITHLDILNTSGVIDKNLMIDEKLVEQLHLVDQSNLVDELVSERLKNIPDFSVQISNGPTLPDNILENNLISNNSNLDPELDFEALSEEFNRNTRS
ncbi:uncharacterized protein LOC124412890 [Diprion similis]|uniref:uncharacterized protein LOC124412890 n=1 Tax=Diprion similis TaxID=362088 RepID=UPI001EF7CE16|nr:uncharacterized protein LOC124412890 [Diprion similis]